jgi:hypothetical protein
MATPISCTQTFPAPPEEVWALLTDPQYIEAKGLRSGAAEVAPQVRQEEGRILVISRRTMHLPDSFPGFIKRFTGDSLVLLETQQWQPAGGDGVRRGTFIIDFGGQPLAFHGELELRASAAGSEVVTSGTLKASVPLIGGKAEGVARDWTVKYLRKEEVVAAEWLAR